MHLSRNSLAQVFNILFIVSSGDSCATNWQVNKYGLTRLANITHIAAALMAYKQNLFPEMQSWLSGGRGHFRLLGATICHPTGCMHERIQLYFNSHSMTMANVYKKVNDNMSLRSWFATKKKKIWRGDVSIRI